ncbi:MAG: hypothetical protein ACYC9N_02850 [Thermoanaerobaculia bacterium]
MLSGTTDSDAGRFRRDLPGILAEVVDAVGRDPVVLQDALHEHREIEHAGDRVVDLVRDAGGELSECMACQVAEVIERESWSAPVVMLS